MPTTRRIVAAAAGTIALAFAATSCSAGAGGDEIDPSADITEQTLTVSIWADYSPEDLAEQFEEATGVKTTIVNHTTNEDIVAKLTASADSGIDVAFVSGQYAQALAEQGLLRRARQEPHPERGEPLPRGARSCAYDQGNVYSEPYAWGTTGLCYRPDLTGYDPTSWNDLLNPKPELVGKTTMLSTDRWLVDAGAQGAGPLRQHHGRRRSSTRRRRSCSKTKPTLLAYDDTTFYSKLVSGEAAMVEAWDGWCNYGIAEDPSIKFVVPEEGTDLWVDTMIVLKTLRRTRRPPSPSSTTSSTPRCRAGSPRTSSTRCRTRRPWRPSTRR